MFVLRAFIKKLNTSVKLELSEDLTIVVVQKKYQLLIWVIVEQGPAALAVGAGRVCLDIFFSRLSFLSSFSLSLGDGPI